MKGSLTCQLVGHHHRLTCDTTVSHSYCRCCCPDDGILSSALTVELRTKLGGVQYSGGIQKNVKNKDWSVSYWGLQGKCWTAEVQNDLAQKEGNFEIIWYGRGRQSVLLVTHKAGQVITEAGNKRRAGNGVFFYPQIRLFLLIDRTR